MQKKISTMLWVYEYQFPQLVLTWEFEASVPIHCKMAALSFFSKIGQKMHFIWVIFNSVNIRYLFLLISGIYAKDNKAVTNSGCTDVCFTLNGRLKMLIFAIFIVPILKWLLTKILWKKATILNFFQISTMTQHTTYDSKMVALSKFTEI